MQNYIPDFILTKQKLQKLQDKLASDFCLGLTLIDIAQNEFTIPSKLPAPCESCGQIDICRDKRAEMLKKANTSDSAVVVQMACKMCVLLYQTGFYIRKKECDASKIFLLCTSEKFINIKEHIEILKLIYSLPLISGNVTVNSDTSSVVPKYPDPAHTPNLSSLTRQERTVLALIGRSRTNKEISDDLNISLNTVKSHVSRLLYKLGAANRTDLAVLAVNNHIE